MKNGLGRNGMSGAKATCSVHGRWKPCGLRSESVSTDFHELRQEFNPPIQK